MKNRLAFLVVCLCAIILVNISNSLIGRVSASWAYQFVVNDGKIYIISDKKVEYKDIGSKIGEVTMYSDNEGTYSGNFSNKYAKGTEYYEIIGIDVNNVIAIKENKGQYIKADYGGHYAGNKDTGGNQGWLSYFPFVVGTLLFLIFVVKKRIKKIRT